MSTELPPMDFDFWRHWFIFWFILKNKLSSEIDSKVDYKDIPIQELLERCLLMEDEAAWNEFVNRIMPTIQGVIYNRINRWRTPDAGLVQDLTQDTLIKLFDNNKKALREFVSKHDDSIYAFVKVVASNLVTDYFRRSGNQTEVPLEDFKKILASNTSEKEISRNLRQVEMELRLNKIKASPKDKKIFFMYFREGYSTREISETPGINLTQKQVEAVLARLIRRLREDEDSEK